MTFFLFLLKTEIVGTRSNEYPQSMFLSEIKKKCIPCKSQFYYIKVGCKGIYITRTCYRDVLYNVDDSFMLTSAK